MASVAPDPLAGDLAARVQAVQARLAASAARAGLRDDPYGQVIEAQSAVLSELVAVTREIREAKQPKAVFTDGQVTEVAQRLMAACQAWAGSMVRAQVIRGWVTLAAIVLAGVAIGFGAGWLGRGAPPAETCGPQSGGVVCWHWLTLPSQQPSTPK